MVGPLTGYTVIELAGMGPGPFGCMVMADLGATVVCVERTSAVRPDRSRSTSGNLLNRGKRSIGVDLKRAEGIETVLRLVESADALVEGFRPGVAERLGIGPEECLARNPALVYGRITGWGQEGPLASAAGHDINYVALSGTLHTIGRSTGGPVPPPALIGDFGGGGMLLTVGVLAALLESSRTGRGQVIDAAIIDGSALLATVIHSFYQAGSWIDRRGVNILDTGAHFYDVYETADGKYVSVGPLEPQFYAELLRLTGLDEDEDFVEGQRATESWPELKVRMAEVFRSKRRDEWCALMENTGVCFAPVLSLAEAPRHPHNQARQTFVDIDGVMQPAPAPRFGRTPAAIPAPPPAPGVDTNGVLADAGFDPDEIDELRSIGAVA